MVLIILFLIILLLETVFCHYMRYKQHNRSNVNNSNKINKNVTKQNSVYSEMVTFILKFFDDITFLLLKLVGYIPCHGLRKILYKYCFSMKIGSDSVIYYGLEVRHPWNISIGNGSIIGDHCILDGRFGIHIGNNVNISTGVWMWTLQHDVNSSSFGTEGEGKEIIIEDRVWISSRTTLLPGSMLAEGCVLAAGAVLTKQYDTPFLILGGIPAKIIAKRNNELSYIFDGKHRFFI